MKRLFAALIVTLFATAMGGTALAADKGSADDEFAMDLNGRIPAHAADVKAFVKERREPAKTMSSGWAGYKRVNPVSE